MSNARDVIADLFEVHVPVLELVLRGTLVYWLLFLIFRFLLRRDVGAVGIADILLLVIVADAAQNAMSGGYDDLRRRRDPGAHHRRVELGCSTCFRFASRCAPLCDTRAA